MTYTFDDYVIDFDRLRQSSDTMIECILDNLVYKAQKAAQEELCSYMMRKVNNGD